MKAVDCPAGAQAKVNATIECKATLQNGETDLITIRVVGIAENGTQHLAIVAAKKIRRHSPAVPSAR